MGGSWRSDCAHRVHPLRFRDALQRCSPRSSNVTLADVRASPRTTSDTSTSPGADSALIRDGDVHRTAEDVVRLADHVAGVDAEVQRQPAVVARDAAAQRSIDRLRCGRERRQHAVAEQLAVDRRAAGSR